MKITSIIQNNRKCSQSSDLCTNDMVFSYRYIGCPCLARLVTVTVAPSCNPSSVGLYISTVDFMPVSSTHFGIPLHVDIFCSS